MEASCFEKDKAENYENWRFPGDGPEALATSWDWKTTTNLQETLVEAGYLYNHRSDIIMKRSVKGCQPLYQLRKG